MRVIPTLEILDGRCVSLQDGKLDDPIIWHVDPIETAQGFAEAGADLMRVTNFDAIVNDDASDDLIAEIIQKAGISVQVAGGMRSKDRVEAWIDRGAAQVVVGSMAAFYPDSVQELAKYHPDQIVLSLDVWQGRLMTDGWRNKSALTPEVMINAFDTCPLAGIVITDIDSDMDDVDAQLGLISGLAEKARFPVTASGVVDTLDDIARLKYIPKIDSALIGRALMRKTFTLPEAIAAATSESEAVAEFQ